MMMMISMMLYVSSIRRAVGKLVGRSASIFVHLGDARTVQSQIGGQVNSETLNDARSLGVKIFKQGTENQGNYVTRSGMDKEVCCPSECYTLHTNASSSAINTLSQAFLVDFHCHAGLTCATHMPRDFQWRSLPIATIPKRDKNIKVSDICMCGENMDVIYLVSFYHRSLDMLKRVSLHTWLESEYA